MHLHIVDALVDTTADGDPALAGPRHRLSLRRGSAYLERNLVALRHWNPPGA